MFVFTSPRYQQVEPTGKVPVPGGIWGTKGPETETGGGCEPQRGHCQAVLIWGDGDIPLPPAVTHCWTKFPPQSCLYHSKRVQITLHQLAAAYCSN